MRSIVGVIERGVWRRMRESMGLGLFLPRRSVEGSNLLRYGLCAVPAWGACRRGGLCGRAACTCLGPAGFAEMRSVGAIFCPGRARAEPGQVEGRRATPWRATVDRWCSMWSSGGGAKP
jgi:hypothetical protein